VAIDANDISTFEVASDKCEVSFVFGGGGKNLKRATISLNIDEHELGSGASQADNTTSHCDILFFDEDGFFNTNRFELLDEVIKSVSSVELVRIRILSFVSL